MKTNVFLKALTCILLTFVTLRFVSNNFDSSDDVTSYSIQAQGRELTYQRLVKEDRQGQSNPSTGGKESKERRNPDAYLVTNPGPLVIDVNNLNKEEQNRENGASISKEHNNIMSFRVDGPTAKKAVKSFFGKDGKIKSVADSNSARQAKTQDIKSLSKQFFSSGFGLKPVKTDSGETVLMENGVVYRPIRKDPMLIFEKHPSPRLTNYEPFIPYNETVFFGGRSKSSSPGLYNTKGKEKIILWYTPARYAAPASIPKPLRFCPDFPCRMTTNRKYFNQSSLVVFNGQLVSTEPPKRASADQLYMFHNQEPPIEIFFKKSNFKNEHWRSVFNWTMTYRTDSTIPSYYGIVRKHPNPPEKDYRKILAEKNGTVAWMVSHCGSPSKRDKYVEILRKYIDVDIYGGCGTFKCEREDDEKCNRDIAKKYKFYLAFENGVCPDYVSEKFFRFMPLDILTVSRSMRDNLDFRSAPGTYVDAYDFSTPKKLAEQLTYLDKNDEEYIKMLREKDKYIYLFEDYPIRKPDGRVKYIHYHYEAVPFCQACRRLWNMKEGASQRIGDIGEWFDRKLCVKPGDLRL